MIEEVKVWIQFFYEDGSVSQGKRIPAYYLDEGYESMLESVTNMMMKDLNRTRGHRLIWGAGNMVSTPICLCEEPESETLALET